MSCFSTPALDRRGHNRSFVTFPEHRLGKKPANFGRKYPAEPLTPEEVYAMLSACGAGPSGIRNQAMIVIMWRGGLRIAEALALLPKDIDLRNGLVTVLHGKGDRRRTVVIDPQAADTIAVWGRKRAELALNGEHRLLCTVQQPTPGLPMWDSVARETLKRIARRAGLTKRVHPHGLRHTHAYELALEGVPLHLIRRQLGHHSLDTTERYIDHLAPLQLRRAIRERTWEPPAATHLDP